MEPGREAELSFNSYVYDLRRKTTGRFAESKGPALDRTGNKEERFSEAGRGRICPSLYSGLRQ